ncbi:hypothetical protein SBA2_410057 [Acidobacteriia bacterium SbA2]|nr:hypothetical protein SBA2_410057 [Acidobacteriia bacterium SbA2]
MVTRERPRGASAPQRKEDFLLVWDLNRRAAQENTTGWAANLLRGQFDQRSSNVRKVQNCVSGAP